MRLAPAMLLVLALLPAAAGAEVVRFKNGYALEVDAYRVVGEKLVLEVSGGRLTVPADLVESIEDNELVTALPGAPEKRRQPTRLDFKGGSQPPDAPYGSLIHKIARRLRFNSALLAAIVEVESGFDANKVSAGGRRGLLQVDPEHSFGVDPARLLEPEANLEAGVRHLNWLRKRYGNDFDRVLAAYHFGRELIDRAGGVPPDPEVGRYLEQVRHALRGR